MGFFQNCFVCVLVALQWNKGVNKTYEQMWNKSYSSKAVSALKKTNNNKQNHHQQQKTHNFFFSTNEQY